MTVAEWSARNDAYLGAALTWLRLRLARLAPPAPPQPMPPREEGVSLFERLSGRRPDPERVSERAPEKVPADSGKPFVEGDPPPALPALAERFGLSSFEADLLLLCAGMELDTRIPGLCARAQDDPARPFPTFALALALFDDPSWDALSPHGPLRRWKLLEVHTSPGQPLTASALAADERIVNHLKGLDELDARLALWLQPVPTGVPLAPSQAARVEEILAQLAAGSGAPLQLTGPDAASTRQVAAHAAAELGLPLYRLAAESLPAAAPAVADAEALARWLEREMLLSPLVLLVEAHELDGPSPALARLLANRHGLWWVATREPRPELAARRSAVEVAKPTAAEQRAAWAAALGDEAAAGRLAGQFDFDLETLGQVARRSGGSMERAWSEALAASRPRLDGLAQRIHAPSRWDDLVLPERELGLLRQIAAQVRHRGTVYDTGGFAARRSRGLGTSVLFAGDSGTGKTLAAEVLANELGLALYRIDLSMVVSKYIGETEKNLRRLFDAAEDGGVILFFDEADALFGKRSEVKDSHDRYANIEINYLLQRIESFRGLAILATNLKTHLDSAFLRRLRFVVDFPAHGEAERRAIWQRAFPPETPQEGLAFERLAKVPLNGGAIANAALNAAFLAADQGTPVTMPVVFAALKTELVKLGRPIHEADFRWSPPPNPTPGGPP